MACSSDAESNSGAAGATSGGNASTSAGSGGSSIAGAIGTAGSTAGGSGGNPGQGGGGGANAQAGAAAGGATSGGAAGTPGGGSAAGGASGSGGASGAAGASSGGSGGASTGAFALTSPVLAAMAGCAADNKTACPVFPKENIGTNLGGSNKSPEFDWTAGPTGTQSYAIVMQDLTNITAGKPLVHWTMWNIPSATRMLPAGLETAAMPSVPPGSSQRSFSASNNGFQGSGKCGNVYEFILYALPTATYTGSSTSQTAVRDGLATTNAPTATLRARSGAPGCTE